MSFVSEKIIETKSCQQCQISFSITDKDLEFYGKVSPVFEWKKYSIPAPNSCPGCREQQRFSFRNERKLYKRECDAVGKSIISIYSPDKSYKVYSQEFWWSDEYNPTDYWMEIDFSQSFFEQYEKLFLKVPKSAIQNADSVNSEYTNYSHNNKNCHLLVWAGWCEDCQYGYRIVETKHTIDSFDLSGCENNYECVECRWLYGSRHSRWCSDSSNLDHCEYCVNCKDCFGCINLTGKQYHIFNKPYDKQDYEREIRELQKNPEQTDKQFADLRSSSPCKSIFQVGCENVSWDQLTNCENCQECYYLRESQDIKHSSFWTENKHSQDINFVDQCELQYNATNLQKNYKVAFGFLVWTVTDSYYVSNCMWWSNLFLCTGIKDSKYCILNKQYTKREYEELVPKIIEKMKEAGEWGEFFPTNMSPFGYNETVANDHFLLESSDVQKKWFNWSDYEAPLPKVDKTIPASKFPDNIIDIPDDILNWAVECEVTKKPFRIIPQELKFYRKHNLPIPKRHPDQRHLDRMSLINPRRLFARNCNKCSKDIQTTYTPERKEIVYCESCYDKEIY